MKYMNKFVIIVIASCFIGLTSCASVPEETVQLSEAVGKDIQQLYTGYRATVRLSFEQMRQNGLAIIDKLWTPKYLEVLISEGVLDVCAEIEKTAEKTDCIEYWAQGAINDIDEKRKDFLQDIDVKEAELLATIDEAFDRTIRANAAVTAHLKSIRKVKETQNEALQAVGLADVPGKINEGIASASRFTAELTAKIEKEAENLTKQTE